MKVKDAAEVLTKLVGDGYGDLELISNDGRSGDTGSTEIYDEVDEVDGNEDMGRLCDEEVGTKYISIHINH